MLGTLLQVGAGASIGALQSALQHSTGEAGVSSPIYEAVHPEQLVPSPVNGHRPFVRYPGSLTTPPCSEGVQASSLGQWGMWSAPTLLNAARSTSMGFDSGMWLALTSFSTGIQCAARNTCTWSTSACCTTRQTLCAALAQGKAFRAMLLLDVCYADSCLGPWVLCCGRHTTCAIFAGTCLACVAVGGVC